MVLYKRKQVSYIRPPPVPENLDTEIYIISQTKEWFLNYEEYLDRIDYYNRREFVCEITGNSCLTYYEAYDSENKEIQDLETNFPEALREPILKYLQFNRISRVDLLVDKVYSVFKAEYFPGEEVYLKAVKQKGVIREKVQYSNPSGTKYLVATLNDNSQIIATNKEITRDRKQFTKWLVKSYVKLTVTRSPKSGAPWVVKPKYAQKYRISKEFPEDLKQFEHLTPSGEIHYQGDEKSDSPLPADAAEIPRIKKPRGRAAIKIKAALKAAQEAAANGIKIENMPTAESVAATKTREKADARSRFPVHHLPASIREVIENSDSVTTSSFQPSKKTIIEDLQLTFDLQNRRPTPSVFELPQNARQLNLQVAQYIESEVEELRNTTDDLNVISRKESDVMTLRKTCLSSAQEALECWTFLNIYHSVLKLDTFTFDDFLCAMGWNNDQLNTIGRCELLDEIWCAVLALVVSKEPVSGKHAEDVKIPGLQITLPPDTSLFDTPSNTATKGGDQDGEGKGSDSETETRSLTIDDEASDKESASTSPKKTKRSDISIMDIDLQKEIDADDEAEGEADSLENQETAENGSTVTFKTGHQAYAAMNYRGTMWHERLRKRMFKDGAWQSIVLGVLSLVEYIPEYAETIEKVYHTLAPAHIFPASLSSVLSQFYGAMSIDLRLKVLQILTSLVVNGNAVRNYIDESLDTSANMRRTRLDILRDWKVHVDTANKLHTEIYTKLMDEVAKAKDMNLWTSFSRKRHRLKTKGYEMTEYEKSVAASDVSFQKLWDSREFALSKIREARTSKKAIETRISQLDCQRVKLLGKDRHFNRYWWFENNGLPNIHYSGGGDEDEEQPEPESDDEIEDKEDFQTETYLMGCLWIQGPTGMDMLSRVKVTNEEAKRMVSSMGAESSIVNDDLIDENDKAIADQSHMKCEHDHKLHGNAEVENGIEKNGHRIGNNKSMNGGLTKMEMDFSTLPKSITTEAAKVDVYFENGSISSKKSSVIVDRDGGLIKDFDVSTLSVLQRKFIEEQAVPLFSAQQWRIFNKVEDVDNIIKWLNPWGKRESVLRKELLRVREGMTASIAARRKALWIDKLPKEEAELEGNLEAVASKIGKVESGETEEIELEEAVDHVSISRKRPNRRVVCGPNKRHKTTRETLKSGSLDELYSLREELKATLAIKLAENQVTRVIEWVNRTARDEFEKSLYEGGDKARPRGRKPKK